MTVPLMPGIGTDSPFMGADEQPDPGANSAPDEPPSEGLGRWLEMAEQDPEKVPKEMVREFERQDPAMTRRKVFWDRNTLWDRGYCGVRALPMDTQNIDRSAFRLHVPLGTFDTQPPMPRAHLLAERVTAHLLADPPVLEAEPANGSDEARDAALFAKRVLADEAGEGGCNYQQGFRSAQNKASVFGSGFLYFYVDPTGGGKSVSGEWIARLKYEVLTGLNCRFLPEACTSIDDADGMMAIRVKTLGQLRDLFPVLKVTDEGYVGDDKLMAMVNWRNQAMNWAMPWFAKMGMSTSPIMTQDGKPSDETLVGALCFHIKQSPSYPKGAYLVCGGDAVLLHAGTWVDEFQDPDAQQEQQEGVGGLQGGMDDGVAPPAPEPPPMREEALSLPFAQFKQWTDDDGNDPYGYGMTQTLGPADEVRNSVSLAGLDHLDRFLRPNMLVPFGSNVQPEDYVQRMGIPIEYNAAAGAPFQEEIGPFDPFGVEMFTAATEYQDDASTLEQTAQAGESPTVKSGIHAEVVIDQAEKNISGLRQNLGTGITRSGRIILEQVRAFMPGPNKLQYTTEDGVYAEKEWTRADLQDAKEIKIAIGSFTGMTPRAKVALASTYAQMGLIDNPDDLKRVTQSGIHPLLGLETDPTTQRVRRQIATWKDGPPEGWIEGMAQFMAAQSQLPPEPMLGAPEGQPDGMGPPPMGAPMGMEMPQPPPSPFDDIPSDHEPNAAVIRHRELFRVCQSTDPTKFPPPWLAVLYEAEIMARMDAGILTAQEQAQAATQQQAEGMDAAAKDGDKKHDQAKEMKLIDGDQKAAQAEQQAALNPPQPAAA